ncbi:MAG: hypothetical protein Q8R30_04705 [bacterium]|nr:hypothetical protein [bacterium]
MPWFIIAAERKTWTKYLVEAADEEDAHDKGTDGEYIGYLDGDDDSSTVHGPFPSRDAALADVASVVDGR